MSENNENQTTTKTAEKPKNSILKSLFSKLFNKNDKTQENDMSALACRSSEMKNKPIAQNSPSSPTPEKEISEPRSIKNFCKQYKNQLGPIICFLVCEILMAVINKCEFPQWVVYMSLFSSAICVICVMLLAHSPKKNEQEQANKNSAPPQIPEKNKENKSSQITTTSKEPDYTSCLKCCCFLSAIFAAVLIPGAAGIQIITTINVTAGLLFLGVYLEK